MGRIFEIQKNMIKNMYLHIKLKRERIEMSDQDRVGVRRWAENRHLRK